MTSSEDNPTRTRAPLDVTSVGMTAGFSLIALMAGFIWFGSPDSASQDPSAQPQPAESTSTAPAPQEDPGAGSGGAADGGELEIVESGYTPMKDLAGDQMVSWGVIVENTSKESVAWSAAIIEVTDEDGKSLLQENDWDASAQIHGLLPGERVGVGSTSYVDDGTVGEVKIAIGSATWYPVGKSPSHEGTLAADEIEVAWEGAGDTANYWTSEGLSFPVNERGTLTLTFRIESGFTVLLTGPTATALYRDKDGEIIGASRPDDFELFGDIPPGWSIRGIEVSYGPPPELDEGTIEIYPQSGI